ncbi:MAG TPA: dihydroorotate dehydrogenase electron transfer subunit [Candidatus Sumerlaeota bacterium]|nr:dihydroorotate dehydrogenase electron transfer subunit [Candidatus Sumerlaeota bacterium]
MKQVSVELIRNETLIPGTVLHHYRDAEIAATARPGQFVNIRPGYGSDPLLRRPFSICTVDRSAGTFTVLIKEVGAGTRMLLALRPGARVDMLAPLGRSFAWDGARRLLLVAGGVGVAPLLFVANEARARETGTEPAPEVIFCYGARTAGDFVLLDQIRPVASRLVLTTNDGSLGEAGFVTAAAERFFTPETTILTCGPNPMMDDLLRRMRTAGLEGQVSLENQMGCGIGACQGCVVPTRRGYVRICCEGPVLRTDELDEIRF